MIKRSLVVTALTAAMTVLAAVAAGPASSAPPGANHWQFDHWPQQQPWQEARSAERAPAAEWIEEAGFPPPVDPQNWVNPDHMTWEDFRPVPGTTWADPAVRGSQRTLRGALVVVDYPDRPFAVTQPAQSTVFANPSVEAHDLPRAEVPAFYRDLLNTPNATNRQHTIHEYWMEDSGGRIGVELAAFGPYLMPGKAHEYGMANQAGTGCPAGDVCTKDLRTDARRAWTSAVGTGVPAGYDFVFYLSAGQDESSTWQEFGPMKWEQKEEVTDPFGPPDPKLANWTRTRYVDWTSWASGSTIWPDAQPGSSMQAESSGQAVYAHELSHILGVGDNYNNPFGVPARRTYSGMWEMLSRGAYNGPGGPHSRWVIPATAGASMGAHHMLRNKLKLKLIDERNVLQLSRDALASTGLVTATVTARSAPSGPAGLSGVTIAMGADRSASCAVNTNPFCDGGGYQNYTLEVVDRMGSDSFTADHGVLLAKTKNADNAPFIWVVDANPHDIGMTDFVRPDGTKVPITVGDYRQLADALLHAGTNSDSEFEFVDAANRLHFYVVDVARDPQGVLSYRLAVRSLDGAGPQRRAVAVAPTSARPDPDGLAGCRFDLTNTGEAGTTGTGHPDDVTGYARGDVYRVRATVAGAGWAVSVPNELVAVDAGATGPVTVHAKRDAGGAGSAEVTLTATSESNPAATTTAVCTIGA